MFSSTIGGDVMNNAPGPSPNATSAPSRVRWMQKSSYPLRKRHSVTNVQESKPVYRTSAFSRSRKSSRFTACLALAFFVILFLPVSLVSQQNCPLPPAIQAVSREMDIFSDQQEVDLGDAMAESFARRIRIIDDDK